MQIGKGEYRWGRTSKSDFLYEESLSSSKAGAEQWPHGSEDEEFKATFGPVILYRVNVSEATDDEVAQVERKLNTRRFDNEVLVSEMKRGDIVSWLWDEADDFAHSNNFRPIGKVITTADRPQMRGCEIAIQMLDDLNRVFEPESYILDGGHFFKGEDAALSNLTLDGLLAQLIDTSLKLNPSEYLLLVKNIIAMGGANTPDVHSVTPLMHIAENGTIECAKLLISAGANVNARDEHGFTVLMRTVPRNSVAMIRTLIEAGADVATIVSVKGPDGGLIHWTALAIHLDLHPNSKATELLLTPNN